jgi:hypothetical protein
MRKTVIICDSCGTQLPEDAKPFLLTAKQQGTPGRDPVKGEICDTCMQGLSFLHVVPTRRLRAV